MRTLRVSVFLLSCLVVAVGAFAGAADSDLKREVRSIDALAAGDQEALRLLAEEYRRLTPGERGNLSLRIREDAVEFTFRGEFPGEMTPWGMLEYLVSAPGKDYESLLVVSATELKRVQALRPFFEKQPQKGRGKLLSAQLTWIEDGKLGSIGLMDLLAPLKAVERERFRDQLIVNDHGLGGDLNVEADSAGLPRKRVPALLLLTIQLPPKK